MKFRDKRSKNTVEWEYRLFLDQNSYSRFVTGGYPTRYEALVNARSQARYLILSGQADEVEYTVDKMLPSRIPSGYELYGYVTRESIKNFRND